MESKLYRIKEWVSKDLLAFYIEANNKGTSVKEINRGIIKLLPKNGDRDHIKNWFPITLLNVSYKILANVLSLRLTSIFPSA